MSQKYIALTIGPIVDTLALAKSTKALWGSSYIFSYLMKKMIEEFKDERDFIVPYVKDESKFSSGNEIGLFHDRFIFKSEAGDFTRLEDRIAKLITDLARDIAGLDKDEGFNITEEFRKIEKFLKDYLNIKYIEVELEEEKDIIFKINQILDNFELKKNFVTTEDDNNYLKEYFEEDIFKEGRLLREDGFGSKTPKIKSIPEIAVSDYYNLLDEAEKELIKMCIEDGEQNELFNSLKDKLKNKGEKFKQCYKYIAIVQADGDNIGEVIANLETQSDYEKFSKMLFDYATKAHQEVKDYGGLSIYAGGDDILFFAPLFNNQKNENILELCDRLNEIFLSELEKTNLEINSDKSPSMSFGISVNYYKYPLKESLKEAINLLFGTAKSDEIAKNAVAVKVRKHSGQEFSIAKNRATKSYQLFRDLVQDTDYENMLKSLIYRMNDEEFILKQIENNEERLESYFANILNEQAHQEDNVQDFLEKLIELIVETAKENDAKAQTLKEIHSYLRFIKFINKGGGSVG